MVLALVLTAQASSSSGKLSLTVASGTSPCPLSGWLGCVTSCLLAFPSDFHQPLEAWHSSPEAYVLGPDPSTIDTPTSPVQRPNSRSSGFHAVGTALLYPFAIVWANSPGVVTPRENRGVQRRNSRAMLYLLPSYCLTFKCHPKDTCQGISLRNLSQRETVETAVA